MLLLVAAAAGCHPRTRRTPDDTLVVAIEDQMITADPRYAVSNYDAKLGRLVAAGLTSVDTPDGNPRLDLAAAIDRTDPLTIDVTLRDARFSDGTPVTADDVARTYTTAMDPRCQTLMADNLTERFSAVEALGPRRVRFHLVAPLATFMTDVEVGILSFHGAPPGACHPPRVIGAGPYILRELDSRHALLDRNPYYPTPAKLAHVDIRFVRDDSARVLMLVGGSADVLQNTARPDLIDDIAERPRVRVATGPGTILTYLLINNDDPALRDLRVREAIALALDRPAIIAAEFGGRAELATGLLPPESWAYDGDVPRWNRDLPRARRLLDEAGYRPDASGVRLHLVYKTSAVDFRLQIARLLAQQLAQAGIAVEVRAFEFDTFFDDLKKGNYQIASIQTAPIVEPDFYYPYFHSSRIPHGADLQGADRARYRNPEVDRWIEEGRHELDPARRKAIYAKIQRQIATDLPIVPLWHEANIVLTNVDVHGYGLEPDAGLGGLVTATKTP